MMTMAAASVVSPRVPSSKTLILVSGDANRSKSRRILRIARGISSSRLRPIRCSQGDESYSAGENSSSFCIIEGPETVQDFMQMQLQEIRDNIRSRRNKIFLLMEEVRRLRVQQRIKSAEFVDEAGEENEMPDMPSTIPFIPNMTQKTLKQLYLTSFSFVSGIIVFGGLLAPILELKLGLGGTSYEDFIRNMHLPLQLSQVDPIVASFSGGAVGVISALMLVEVNNVEQQEKKRCKYCNGTGYLACARCSASGVLVSAEPVSITGGCNHPLRTPSTQRCTNCSGAGKDQSATSQEQWQKWNPWFSTSKKQTRREMPPFGHHTANEARDATIWVPHVCPCCQWVPSSSLTSCKKW